MIESRFSYQLRQIHAFLGRVLSFPWRFLHSPHLTCGLFLACVLVFMLGLAFPQIPATLTAYATGRARWLEVLQERYPVEIPAPWGLSLRFLAAMLLLSLLLGLFERGETLWRSLRSPEIHPPAREGLRRTFTFDGPPERALRAMRDSFPRRLCRILVMENGGEGEIYLYADRFGFPDWGLFLVQLGLAMAIGLAFYGARLGWHEEEVRLVPERVYHFEHDPALAFRLDRFEEGGAAQITLLKEGQVSKQVAIEAGHPLFCRGLGFYLTASGPFLRVRGRDDDGNALMLQPLVKGSTKQEEISLFFSEAGDERYFSVPGANLTFQVAFQPGKGFAVRAFRPNEARPLVSEAFSEAIEIEVERDRYFLEVGRYAVFHLVWEPGLLPFSGAGGMVALGLGLYLAFRQVRLWGTVRAQGAGSLLELRVEENRLAFGKSFSAWAEKIG